MQQSWSMPVAQALQRHSGGWKASPPKERPVVPASELAERGPERAPPLVPEVSEDIR